MICAAIRANNPIGRLDLFSYPIGINEISVRYDDRFPGVAQKLTVTVKDAFLSAAGIKKAVPENTDP